MPNSDPRDVVFYPTLTLMIYSYILSHPFAHDGLLLCHILEPARGKDKKKNEQLHVGRTSIQDVMGILKCLGLGLKNPYLSITGRPRDANR